MASHIGLVLEKSDVDMQEFVTKFSNKMPLIAMVTSGYLGYDDFLHTFSSDEVYLICGIKIQTRVLVRNRKKQNMSIPLNYPVKFQTILPSGQLSEPASLSTLMDRLTTTGEGDEIMLHNDTNVKFCEGTNFSSSENLGRLIITEKYEEKYLIAYTLLRDKPNGYLQRLEIPIPIPVYMSIRLGVAESLTWDGSLDKMIRAITPKNVNVKDMPINHDVMLLPDTIGSRDYEYIVPSTYFSLTNTVDQHVYEKANAETTVPEMSPSASGGPPLPSRDHGTRPPQVKPKPRTTSTSKPAIYPPAESMGKTSSDKLGKINLNALTKVLPTGKQGKNIYTVPTVTRSQSKVTSPAGQPYKQLRDVPADLTGLSLQDVACCLQLLQLNGHVKNFRQKSIDGKLLASLDNDMLVDDLKFTKFEAMKMLKFINGWRLA